MPGVNMRTSIAAAIGFLLFLITFHGAPPATAGSLDDLLIRVPDQANALLVVDVPALHKSRMGVRENWAKRHERQFMAGVASIPPSVQRVVLAAEVNPSTL